MRVISEPTHFSQKKLIEGQSLHVREHGIGYSDLAFLAFKGQNWAGGKSQQFKVPASSSSGIAKVGISKLE